MLDRSGQQLGNYQLLRLLGEGGFASVYLGEHIHLATQAAIKILHTQIGRGDIEQFRNEARTIAHLEHPHIVRVLDFDVDGNTPFLVMSYAPNGTLRDRHQRGHQLPPSVILSYVEQVADALQYAHDAKIIHRDIKPGNMLLGGRGEVQLSDFGIALVAQSSQYQSTQDMAGTMAYSAPEQIQGKPRQASDQYALAIVVYEWLSGDHPFHGSLTELIGQHLTVPPPPLRAKLPTLSPNIEHVVLTALAKDPKQRFESVRSFADALSESINEQVLSPSVYGQQSPDHLLSAAQPAFPSEHLRDSDPEVLIPTSTQSAILDEQSMLVSRENASSQRQKSVPHPPKGQRRPARSVPTKGPSYQRSTVEETMGINPRQAAVLSYLFLCFGGMWFLHKEYENRFVRFNAAQSVVLFFPLLVILALLQFIASPLSSLPLIGAPLASVFNVVSILLIIAGAILWLFLMNEAAQGVEIKLPFVGEYAEKLLRLLQWVRL